MRRRKKNNKLETFHSVSLRFIEGRMERGNKEEKDIKKKKLTL
jgi:hypothetical protein